MSAQLSFSQCFVGTIFYYLTLFDLHFFSPVGYWAPSHVEGCRLSGSQRLHQRTHGRDARGCSGMFRVPSTSLVRECSLETFTLCWRLFCVLSLLTYSPGILSSAHFFFFEYDCLISMISMCVTNKLLPRICRSFFSVSMLLRTQWIHLSGAKGMMATIKGDMEAEIENGKEQDKKNQA